MAAHWSVYEERILKREFHNGKCDRLIRKYLPHRISQSIAHQRQRMGLLRKDEPLIVAPRDERAEMISELIVERTVRERIPLTLDNILTGTPPRGRSAYDGFKPRGGPIAEAKERPQPWHPLMSPKRFGDHSLADDTRETT